MDLADLIEHGIEAFAPEEITENRLGTKIALKWTAKRGENRRCLGSVIAPPDILIHRVIEIVPKGKRKSPNSIFIKMHDRIIDIQCSLPNKKPGVALER